jgi:hypothetical protein
MIYPTGKILDGRPIWVEEREDGTYRKFLLEPRQEEMTFHRRRSSSHGTRWEIRGGTVEARMRMLRRLTERGIRAILSNEDIQYQRRTYIRRW